MGFRSIINVRRASEAGAEVEAAEGVAANNYIRTHTRYRRRRGEA